jgi:UDP-N-acetylglucosamine 4-epimerase
MVKDEQVSINGDGQTSRDFCYITNVVQANLLAASTQKKEAFNQVYNIAVGGCTTLNELYEKLRQNLAISYPHVKDAKPVYREFRAGDVRHSLASIDKAIVMLKYEPSQNLEQGLLLALPWYVSRHVASSKKLHKDP